MSHDTAGRALRRAVARASAAWLAEGRDTKFCIVAEGATLGCDTARLGHDTAGDTTTIRRQCARNMAQHACAGICLAIQFLYRDDGQRDRLLHGRGKATIRQLCVLHGREICNTACGTARGTVGRALLHGQECAATRPGVHCDTAGRVLRHGRACAATRPGVCCDTTWPGLRHGAVRGPGRSALAARVQCVHTMHLT